MKNGFTLVELSIVLIIIGLLVGGILVAQSLIDTVKINRLVSDLKQYEIAAVQFKNKFKQIPGDSKLFQHGGNNNKTLDNGGCDGTYSGTEAMYYWSHLSQANSIATDYEVYNPNGCTGGPHSDVMSDASLSGVIFPYTEISEATATAGGASAHTKTRIPPFKPTANSLVFWALTLNPLDVLPLENKIGLATNAASKGGLVNPYGDSLCSDGNFGTVACGADNAALGRINYYVPN